MISVYKSKRLEAFQVFVKPVGARCNLRCGYCYYLPRENPGSQSMHDDLLEAYIIQHIGACTEPVIFFSWHGGEPTLFGREGFRKILAIQKKHAPPDRPVVNGIQTNGILLDDAWCRFLARKGFRVGLSLDGPGPCHDVCRRYADGGPTHARVMETYHRLKAHGVPTECLCVVHAENVLHPLEVYNFFVDLEVPYLTFLPLVEKTADGEASRRSVPARAWGEFLCGIFDQWQARDIGRTKVQIFEESFRPAFGLEHTLCIFKTVCGGVPVLECNGDLYSCDHFVNPEHRLGNILTTPLVSLLDSPRQQAFGRAKRDRLPRQCRACEVLDMCNGGCPRNRFVTCPDGEPGLNYLCPGYLQFFRHCRPFIEALASVWRNQPAADGD